MTESLATGCYGRPWTSTPQGPLLYGSWLSTRVAFVRVGDRLRVAQVARHWVVSDHEGALGWLTWRAALNGQAHPVSGRVIRLPAIGTLHVRTLLLSPQGDIKNIGGYVAADDTPPQALGTN